jgi:hypothetical protein
MVAYLHKFGPIAVVGLVFAWCCWPYIVDSSDSKKRKGDNGLLSISKAMLSPTLKDRSERNPFQSIEDITRDLINDKDPEKKKKQEETGEEQAGEGGKVEKSSSLVLQGTMIQGDESYAIIGGKIVSRGDRVATEGGTRNSWIVAKVYEEKVLLKRGAATRMLKYAEPAPPKKSTPTGHAADADSTADVRDRMSELGSIGDLLKTLRGGGGGAVGASQNGLKTMSSVQELMEALQGEKK